MALDKILPTGENGETARVKINASITEVDKLVGRTYDYKKVGGSGNEVTISDDTWTDVIDFAIPERPIGTYEYKHSVTFMVDTQQKSALFRFSIDGGTTWEERSREVKDKTNIEDIDFFFPLEFTAPTTPHLKLQASCEDATGMQIIIKWASQILERMA